MAPPDDTLHDLLIRKPDTADRDLVSRPPRQPTDLIALPQAATLKRQWKGSALVPRNGPPVSHSKRI